MSSQNQIDANRRNAQKSTGPRTDSGKARSRLNALQTGLDAKLSVLPGESSDSFDTLAAEYHHRHAPTTPEQRALVDILVHNEWLLRRFRRIEHEIWDARLDEIDGNDSYDQDHKFREVYESRFRVFDHLQRSVDSTFRQYNQALKALRQLQSQEEEPLPDQSPAPEIGFVPPPAIPGSPHQSEAHLHPPNSAPARLRAEPSPQENGHPVSLR